MTYLLALLVAGGLFLTGDYLLDHSLSLSDAKTNQYAFELPQTSETASPSPDGDYRVRILDAKHKEIARASRYGVILPSGRAYLVVQKAAAKSEYSRRYLYVGKWNDKTKSFESDRVEDFYFQKDFSLAGDRIAHFLVLSKKTQLLTAQKLRDQLSEEQRKSVLVAALREVDDRTGEVFLDFEGGSLDALRLNGRAFSTNESYDPAKPFKLVLLTKANVEGALDLYAVQDSKAYYYRYP